MGKLEILHTYLQDLEQGLPDKFRSHDSIDLCQQRRFSLNVVTAVIKSSFRQTLTALSGELEGTSPGFRECILRRALKIIERFERLPVRQESIQKADLVAIKIQSILLRQLIAAADAEGDKVEVAHLREELSAISSPTDDDLHDALTKSFLDSAHLASGVLQGLAITESDLAALGFTDESSLPTAHRAMHAGFEKIAAKLLFESVERNRRLPDILGRSTIHIAVETGCLQILRYLLEQNPKACDLRDVLQRTPLLIAAWKGQLAAFDILLEAGADITARDLSNRTSLNYACSQGNVPIVEKLLAKGADVADCTMDNLPALCEAATHGHYEVCLVLLNIPRCVNQMCPAAKCAAANGHDKLAELIHNHIRMLNMKQGLLFVQEHASLRFSYGGDAEQGDHGETNEPNSWASVQGLNPDLLDSFGALQDFPPSTTPKPAL
jgi:ankyrin repeat protein